LRNHGIRVARGPTEKNAEYVSVEPIFAAIHTKTLVIDGKIVVVSSANRSDNAFHNNREAGVIIYSQDIAGYFAEAFQRDREHSLVLPPIESQDYLHVSIVSPTNGSVIEADASVIVDVNASVSGTLKLYVDGSLVKTENFTVGYHRFNFTVSLDPGEHEISVIASGGNLVDRAVVYVSVEAEEPIEQNAQENPRLTYAIIALIIIVTLVKLRRKKRFFT
jgi:hypothetical protein